MRNARACESCRASKNRCFFADDSTICQRCDQAKSRCVVREKARPKRARRTARPESSTKLDDTGSPLSSAPSLSADNPSKDGEFSLDLPTTVYHDSAKDTETLQSHHKRVFKDDKSRSPTPVKNALPLPSKYISARKLTLSQATHLLNSYIPKLPFFPFVTLPANPTIRTLSQQSPFLLLAILTTAAIPHPYLHHQLDQEFRRVLSLKLIVESQKSLDYLLGLLVYIAWYPAHTKPQQIPCFTYMNLANSLAIELGLDKAEPQNALFGEFDSKGLVDSDGAWTMEARTAYMGCYVLGSHLSKGFNKPQTMSYENLLPSNPNTFIPSHMTTPATAIVILERVADRINDTWTAKSYPQMDVFSTDLYVQLFTSELDTWKRNVPESITSSPLLALYHKYTHFSIYTHSLRLLRRPYRPFVPGTTEAIPSPDHLDTCLRLGASYFQHILSLPPKDYTHFNLIHWSQLVHSLVALVRLTFVIAHVENWSAETTREKVGLSMYLESLCFRFNSLSSNSQVSSRADIESRESGSRESSSSKGKKKHYDKYFVMHGMLTTLKKTWEKRVEAIVPKAAVISKGKCPMFDPEMAPLLENTNANFDFGDMAAWDDSFEEGMAGWDMGMQDIDMGTTTSTSGKIPGAEETGLQAVGTHIGTPGGIGIGTETTTSDGGTEQQRDAVTLYHDLWATMTSSWSEKSPGWPTQIVPENTGTSSNDVVFGYQINEGSGIR
ncbi:hypothetical protein BCIN_07g06800 [Botrytis cinerea B05.10]|uniref:Zn(2)-C6 fungal-type domain-containing protein n=1 Tax=Botryotinia fuckeliana (strain B05.10) TaxID=332648 RepID=A0A384JNM9_BOTFB|nr:hypothetical protein BCIN_07g06800 [Botrytis cinerea B05.10]ATZ52186.1 hypothetical protein BCIN_07g06800 [Botrytis cinerea B05.10]